MDFDKGICKENCYTRIQDKDWHYFQNLIQNLFLFQNLLPKISEKFIHNFLNNPADKKNEYCW